MNHKCCIVLIAFLFLIVACQEPIDRHELVGRYQVPENNRDYATLRLDDDSTYYLIHSHDFHHERAASLGHWEIKNRQIVLKQGSHLLIQEAIDFKSVDGNSDSVVFTFGERFLRNPKLDNFRIDFDGMKYFAASEVIVPKNKLHKKGRLKKFGFGEVELHNRFFYTSTFGDILKIDSVYIELKPNAILEYSDYIPVRYRILNDGLQSIPNEDFRIHHLNKVN